MLRDYNGKTRVAFKPENMTQEELIEGYMWFRKHFYSIKSIMKRLSVSRTNTIHNFIINLGYKFSIGYVFHRIIINSFQEV